MNHENGMNGTASRVDQISLTDEEREEILDRAFLIDEHERDIIREQEPHRWCDLRCALLEMGADPLQIDRLFVDVVGEKSGALTVNRDSAQTDSTNLATINQQDQELTHRKATLHVAMICGSLLLALFVVGGLWAYDRHVEAEERAEIAKQQAAAQRAVAEEEAKVAALDAKIALEQAKLKERQKAMELASNEKIAELQVQVAQLELTQKKLEGAANTLRDLYLSLKSEEMKVRRALLNYRLALQNVQDQDGGLHGAISTRISEYWRGGTPQERLAWRRYHAFQSSQQSYKQVAREYNEAAQRLEDSGVFSVISLPKHVPLEISDQS